MAQYRRMWCIEIAMVFKNHDSIECSCIHCIQSAACSPNIICCLENSIAEIISYAKDVNIIFFQSFKLECVWHIYLALFLFYFLMYVLDMPVSRRNKLHGQAKKSNIYLLFIISWNIVLSAIGKPVSI